MLDVDNIFLADLRAHAYLGGLLHLLLHLLRQHVAQVDRLSVLPAAHQLHRADEGKVVRDDLSQLVEVPTVPGQGS